MHRAGNFNLEWGYLAPAPSFLRTVRLVVGAAAVAATASAAVVFALMRQPAAEESIAARTLVQSVDQAPPIGRAPVATQPQTATAQAADAAPSAASESGDASVHLQAPATLALAEAPSMMVDVPPAREASDISPSPLQETASSPSRPGKKPHIRSHDERLAVVGSSARVALAPYANRPAPSKGNAGHDSVVRHDRSNVLHHDESVVGRPIRVTDDIVAATQRAISAVAVIPSWIRSISGEGQSPRPPANWAVGREVRSCTRVSMIHRSSGSSTSPAYCDHVNHMHAWNGRDGFGGGGWRRVTTLAQHGDVRG